MGTRVAAPARKERRGGEFAFRVVTRCRTWLLVQARREPQRKQERERVASDVSRNTKTHPCRAVYSNSSLSPKLHLIAIT
eukprot:2646802-Prymnesium_polylepis.2